jgi:Na+/H+-dicarboxylate symporter
MSRTAQVLLGLVAGLLVGIGTASSAGGWAGTIVPLVEPLGTLFINGIRMTVVPLVVSSLIAGVASNAGRDSLGRLGGRALLLAVALLVTASAFAAALAPPIFRWLGIDQATASVMGATGALAGQATGAAHLPSIGDWLVALVPSNPIAAAADGAMLPLIVFSLVFGLAIGRVPEPVRRPVLAFFEGVSAAMLRLVDWVLVLAPIGVFGLAVPLAARLGVGAAGALASYVLVGAVLTTLYFALVVYPGVALAGGVPLKAFIAASTPAQAVAFSSRSSLASLPAMIEGARLLAFPEAVTGCLVPLGAAVFRLGSAVGQTVGVLFAATLYGSSPDAMQLATIVFVVAVTTFTVPGIPAGSIVTMVPILQAANLPIEGIALLLGVDTIPDMIRTTANVTGTMAVTTVVARGALAEPTI